MLRSITWPTDSPLPSTPTGCSDLGRVTQAGARGLALAWADEFRACGPGAREARIHAGASSTRRIGLFMAREGIRAEVVEGASQKLTLVVSLRSTTGYPLGSLQLPFRRHPGKDLRHGNPLTGWRSRLQDYMAPPDE